MTQPVTTGSVPYALKQGVKAKPMPAKQAPVHKKAAANAAKTNTAHKTKGA